MKLISDKFKIADVIVGIFTIIWFSVILLDYFNKHPIYISSIKYFQYTGLYLTVGVIVALIIFHLKYDKWTGFKVPVNGLTITVMSMVFSFLLIFSHRNYAYTETSSSDLRSLFVNIWGVIGFIFLLFFVLKSMGRVVYRRLFKNYIKASYLVDLGFGIILFTLCLFALGLFGGISKSTIIALLFVFSLVNLFDLVQSLKSFFLSPVDTSALNILGIASFCFIVFYLLLNLIASLGPFPSGFDSRNFYLNISQLIAQNNGLVEGYQPYYWSLFMSIGFALFDKVELALMLSYSGIVLTVLAANRFAQRHLKLGQNIRYFCLLLFIVTPAVTNQMYTEHKVDLAMLFFQVLSLDYMMTLIKRLSSINEEKGLKSNLKELLPYVILVGLLSSFALGIKMINMFMVFTILVLIGWDSRNRFGILGIFCFSILVFLYAGVDELSGLNKYHLSIGFVKMALTLIMLASMIMSILRFRKSSMLRVWVTSVYLLCCGVFILPWIVKNFVEQKSLNPRILLMGKDPGPDVSLNKLINNYERSKNR